MQIEMVPIEKVRLCCGNFPRGECRVETVAKHIKEFGWQQPIIVDIGYMVISGHVRMLAAQRLGLKKVPVHVADGLTPAQIKRFREDDNAAWLEAKWDDDSLNEAIADINDLQERKAAERKRRWREARGMAV